MYAWAGLLRPQWLVAVLLAAGVAYGGIMQESRNIQFSQGTPDILLLTLVHMEGQVFWILMLRHCEERPHAGLPTTAE